MNNRKANVLTLTPHALLVLRLWAGVAMIWYSHSYLIDSEAMSGFVGYVDSLGIPAAGFLAPLAKVFELVGGILILTGFYGRIGALLIIPTLLVAVFIAQDGKVFQDASLAFNLLIIHIVIFMAGTGKFTIQDIGVRANQSRET